MEGLALGPPLAGGKWSLVGIVDDGSSDDPLSGNTVMAFELTPPLAGDYNQNGSVDAADYIIWRNTFGSATELAGDGDSSGVVGPADREYWKARFGNSEATSAMGTQLPEPSAAVMVVAIVGLLLTHRRTLRATLLVAIIAALTTVAEVDCAAAEQKFKLQVGAAAVDITPNNFPVIVNGMFEERTADRAVDRLFARAFVLDDGKTSIAIVVVDSCMLPRELLDEAKSRAAKLTGIVEDHILISATHTHSAPAAMGVLGSRADAAYRPC
jgi:hypothetical protein